VPNSGDAHHANAPKSGNKVNAEDVHMESHLPPIGDEAGAKSEKAKQKKEQLQQELAAISAMNMESKLALLKKYVP